MRVWIDLDNSPHVLFFAPVIRKLESDGVEVLVTVRSFAQTEELAAAHGLTVTTIGEHKTPHQFALRVTATVRRAYELARYVRGFRPEVAISHGSRGLVLASWMLGIPSMTLYDYEFISSAIFHKLSSRILVPSVVAADHLRNRSFERRKVTPYPGLKEEMYIYDFRPDDAVLSELGLDPERLIITLRPPGQWAHYHNEKSELLFRTLVARLRCEEDAQVVVLPRTEAQKEDLVLKYGMASRPFRVIERAVDGLSLICHSDAVFSGGGTMVREAALLGVDVFSIFAGRVGSADQSLMSTGRLRLIKRSEDIEGMTFTKRVRAENRVNRNHRTRDFIFNEIIGFARAHSREVNNPSDKKVETQHV